MLHQELQCLMHCRKLCYPNCYLARAPYWTHVEANTMALAFGKEEPYREVNLQGSQICLPDPESGAICKGLGEFQSWKLIG